MKIITLVLGILLFACSHSFSSSWEIATVDSSGPVLCFTSIALDSSDYPHIAHYAYTNENLRYMYYDGSIWHISAVDTDGIVGWQCSLALDSYDQPHISYFHYDNRELKYAYFNGSNWEISTLDSIGQLGIWSSSIAIDSANHPHISYFDAAASHLKYAYYDGSTWWLDTVDPTFAVGQDTCIAIDNNDHPHISYAMYGAGNLGYAYNDGYGWQISTVDTGNVGFETSIDVDSDNHPHIAYRHALGFIDGELKYAYYDGNNWQISLVDSNEGVAYDTSIKIDSLDHPHISYFDETDDDLEYAYFNGLTWELTTVDSVGAVGPHDSLALDSTDAPHISYFDYTNGTIKYAYYLDDTGVSLLSFTAQPQPNSAIKLVWQVAASDDTQILGFNLYRAGAGKARKKDWTQLNSSPITGKNPYQFVDSSVYAGQTYHYRLSAISADGKEEMLGTAQGEAGVTPAQFALTAVYPNPTVSLITCRLTMPQAGSVTLGLYDISGRLVLAKRYTVSSGEQETALEVGNLAKGIYTVRASSGGESAMKRIVVMR